MAEPTQLTPSADSFASNCDVAEAVIIRGASEHNLKGVDLVLPKRRLIVFTGVSGSGKSSLAFDTLYAEGQRRYVESLSAYARQFLGQMDKPRYDTIRGLAPTISIEQRATTGNPRSTVGTVTEIYDYLRLLFARAGVTHCPTCDRVTEHTEPQKIVQSIQSMGEGARLLVLAPIARQKKGTYQSELEGLRTQGYTRVRIDGSVLAIDDVEPLDKNKRHDVDVVVDRVIVRQGDSPRLTDSVETALKVGEGRLVVQPMTPDGAGEERLYSESRHCAYCEVSLPDPTPAMFSFNSPIGACPTCNGLGTTHEVDLDSVVPDDSMTIAEGCIGPWANAQSPQQRSWSLAIQKALAKRYGIELESAWRDLPQNHRRRVLHGTGKETIDVVFGGRHGETTIPMMFEGVVGAIERRFKESTTGAAVEHYKQYLREVSCPACEGERLRPEARAVRIGDWTLPGLTSRTIGCLHTLFSTVELEGNAAIIAAEVLREVRARLGFLVDVGLTYLTLGRKASTLSGGEAQRIRLASQVGSELTGVLYILDEPSIGLHPRDNARLLRTLRHLRDIGNTVIVVEHDAETMLSADHLVDFGPAAGVHGGHIIATGTPQEVMATPASLTGQYLSGQRMIELPSKRRRPTRKKIVVRGAAANNLKGIDVAFPVGLFTVVTGVSGAGKSSLVNGILHPAISRHLHGSTRTIGDHGRIDGLDHITRIVAIDQKPIGRTPRSNPATYTKLFDTIRKVFAATRESRVYGYKAGRFSFNVKGGRCEACEGAGVKKIEMHFLADVYVECDTCRGRRFNDATLRVRFRGKTIHDVLEMTIDEAWELFEAHRNLSRVLQTLRDVGLGYVKLGQPATTLSGGEAQRVKLSRELGKRGTGTTLYLLDEPSTGLHFEDVRKLLGVVSRLVDQGNTVVMIEHNLDIIKTADHVIDLGPEGGDGGGRVIAVGSPEAVAKVDDSHTGRFLREALKPRAN